MVHISPEVHLRQLRALLEHLDVAYGVAVTSTNGERNMRPQGREERGREESGQCAVSCQPLQRMENFTGKADWYANMVDAPRYFLPKIPSLTFTLSKSVESSYLMPLHPWKFTDVSRLQLPRTSMLPVCESKVHGQERSEKVRTGAQRRAQESSFGVCLPSMVSQ